MSSVCFMDFETRSAVDLKKSGADVYARHPSTHILCFGFKFDEEPAQIIKRSEPLPQRVMEHILSGQLFVAHNASFELNVWNNVCAPKYKWPRLLPEQTECTMCMAYAMALPGSLEKSSAAVGINQQKDMAGNRVMMKLSQPKQRISTPWGEEVLWYEENEHPDLFEKLYAYCIQDINVEHALYKRLLKLSEKERRVWLLDQKINQRGIQIDIAAAKTAIELVEMEKERLDKLMRQVTGNQVATCTASKQLTDWITGRGFKLDGVAKSDVLELLSRENLPADIRKALLLRQEAAKASTAKLKAMAERVGPDGRVRGIFQYHGAGTGRWAGRGIQPQNLPRPNLEQNEIEDVFKILGSVK